MCHALAQHAAKHLSDLSALSADASHACREHKPILKAAYFNNSSDPLARSKFSLELTKSESVALCQAFDRKKAAVNGGSRGSQRPQPIPTPSVAPAAQRYVAERRANACHLSALFGSAAWGTPAEPCPASLSKRSNSHVQQALQLSMHLP